MIFISSQFWKQLKGWTISVVKKSEWVYKMFVYRNSSFNCLCILYACLSDWATKSIKKKLILNSHWKSSRLWDFSLRNGYALLFWIFSNPHHLRECELNKANGILSRVFWSSQKALGIVVRLSFQFFPLLFLSSNSDNDVRHCLFIGSR